MALTAAQLTDLQRDIGIGSDESIFTDDELNRLYDRADSYAGAVAYAVRQLLMDAARFNDYTVDKTKESRSQIFAHLKQMYGLWAAEAGIGTPPLVSGTIEQDLIEPYSTTEYGST